MYILFSMVRTRTFDPATALTRAVELFSSKGYADTSMEDIVRATGVSRYGLYGTFGNKRELFEQALDRYADRMGKQSFLALFEPDATLEDIRQIFRERIGDLCESGGSRGCLFIHTAMSLAVEDDDLRAVLRRYMKGMTKAFATGLETARSKGQVRKDVDVRAAGQMLTSTMFGLVVLGKSGFPQETLQGIVDNMLDSFTG